jgi:hypothetical protein
VCHQRGDNHKNAKNSEIKSLLFKNHRSRFKFVRIMNLESIVRSHKGIKVLHAKIWRKSSKIFWRVTALARKGSNLHAAFWHCADSSLLKLILSGVGKGHNMGWMIDCLRFYISLKNFSLIWRHHHCHWRAAKFVRMLELYRATPTVTRGLSFPRLIQRTAPYSRLLQYTRGCGRFIQTRILTEVMKMLHLNRIVKSLIFCP